MTKLHEDDNIPTCGTKAVKETTQQKNYKKYSKTYNKNHTTSKADNAKTWRILSDQNV